MQRRKFRVLLATKREQEKRVAEFLSKLPMEGEELYSRQKTLCRTDETRPKGEMSVCMSVYLCVCMYLMAYHGNMFNAWLHVYCVYTVYR